MEATAPFNYDDDVASLQIFTHISCQCEICHGCMQEHITVAVMERNIRELTCPVCQKPDFKEVDPMQHFQHVGHEVTFIYVLNDAITQ